MRRARIHKLIDRSLVSGACWVAAPAGYGKTTALIDYLQSAGTRHIWYRVDEGDRDVARFFHYLAQSLPSKEAIARLPVFAAEYAEQKLDFARRFFRAYFSELEPATVLVLDDLHDADTPDFRGMLAVMLRELPDAIHCICLSRTLPQDELGDLALNGRLTVIDQSVVAFSESEARSLVKVRLKQAVATIDFGAARGWAMGLVMLAEQGLTTPFAKAEELPGNQSALFDVLGRQLYYTLPPADQDMLLQLNLLPEISSGLAEAMIGSREAANLLERLYQRQLLVKQTAAQGHVFQLHDLLRDFLDRRLAQDLPAAEQQRLRERAATILRSAGRPDDAVALALQAENWMLARDLMLERAESLLAQGQRATFMEWCGKLPPDEMNAWLLYWLGVAHIPDDAEAEQWLSRAWSLFEQAGDLRGQCLTVARAVLVKTSSWRTHEGLAAWTARAAAILDHGLPQLPPLDDLLVRIGMLRAVDFADVQNRNSSAESLLTAQLIDRLARHPKGDSTAVRLLAGESMIEHAVSTGSADLFEKALDSVAGDLSDPTVPPWVLGNWLVAFGAASGRYFSFARRGFPYASAEDALRAAIAIGERESLRGVEFGALYHLQMLMKLRNDFSEFSLLIKRLAEIADSRFTTQIAVVADCHAAMHTRQANFAEAYRDCDRFMAAIEAANEPIIERLPHYITKFQVLLADKRTREAVELLAELLPRLDSGASHRIKLCILAAEALDAKWNGDASSLQRLGALLTSLRAGNWPAILLNLPELLAELLADALDHDIETDLCRALIETRQLVAPARRPARWPWLLKVHVLGEFRLELDGAAVDFGAKPPTRALDILRVLAIAKDNSCSLETLQDWLWPDLDGDQAKAACDQALHRLRRLVGQTELIVQREGRLRLQSDKVWVDLADWEAEAVSVLGKTIRSAAAAAERERLLAAFPGPLLFNGRTPAWSLPVGERVRDEFLDLAIRLGEDFEAEGKADRARSIYLRGLDFYPDSSRIYHALLSERLARNDVAGAIEDYSRYERTLKHYADSTPSAAIAALIRPHLKASHSRFNA